MVKYVAKCDTVYKFKFYRAGDTLEEVDGFDNGNFARADGKPVEKASATVNNTENNNSDNNNPSTKAISEEEVIALRAKAKELGIKNWHIKKLDTLIAEITEAEAKLAQPDLNAGSAETEPKETTDGNE